MFISFLLKGLVIGFSIAAPVGPIGVLCISRTLSQGKFPGFITGLGAATADGVYGIIAALGLTFVSRFLINEQVWIHSCGGVFLLYLGAKTFLSRPSKDTAPVQKRGLAYAYGSTFFLTLANPLTILSFTAVFAGLGAAGVNAGHLSRVALVAGVFGGSTLWWIILSSVAGLFRSGFNLHTLGWINRISGAVITGFGVYALLSLLL